MPSAAARSTIISLIIISLQVSVVFHHHAPSSSSLQAVFRGGPLHPLYSISVQSGGRDAPIVYSAEHPARA